MSPRYRILTTKFVCDGVDDFMKFSKRKFRLKRFTFVRQKVATSTLPFRLRQRRICPSCSVADSDASTESAVDIIVGSFVGRCGENLFGFARFDHFAEEEVRGIVGDPERLLHIVRNHDYRHVLFEFEAKFLYLAGGYGVERACRLVHKQNLRFDGERAGDAKSLLLTARQSERDAVVSSVWEQINSRVNGSNDYVKFNLVAKNGELKPVLNHGRIVNTEYFGRVFYVLIIDSALLETHYADDVVTAG